MDTNKQLVDMIRGIFTKVRDLPTGERAEGLADLCKGNAELQNEVESLLRVYDSSSNMLQRNASGTILDGCSDLVGITIGHYHLEELLGEGGFGEVYRAEQTEPLRREVALKIVKLGMDTKQVLGRFEAERQALARMDHPNIAQVYDAGVTDAGRPYFVMELVRGIPLLDYCDRVRLPLTERIELFMQVCAGVQHAHQKGILHRDLKPSNILVAEENGKPLPKVIDFGVAKSLEGRLTDQTLVTMREQVMGTPMYMSPEQLGHTAADIDTRTDIYSLGIILYELLAGATPFQDELPSGISEMRRIMETIELPRPSRLSHALGDSSVAHARGLKTATLEKRLHGDLDWIVMKAIAKERERRYEDVGTLSMDLLRHLEHKPVSAGPPSLAYRSRKFVRRHRTGLAATAFILTILLIGAWISTAALLRAVRESERARLQESRALSATERAEQQELRANTASEQARKSNSRAEASQHYATQQSEWALREGERATQEAEHARKQQALAEATFGFLADELLLRADPAEEPDRDIKLRTVVDQAAERLEHHLVGQPLEKARIHQMLGNLYLRLAEYDKARKHADESVRLVLEELGPERIQALACLHDQAEVMSRQGEHIAAVEQFQLVWEARRDQLGVEHPDTLRSLHGLTVCLYVQGRHEEAEEKFRYILEIQKQTLGTEHPDALRTLNDLGWVLSAQGAHTKSAEIHFQVLETRRRVQGPEHPDTLQSMEGLARALRGQNKSAEVEALQREMLEIRRRVLGPEHPDTLDSTHGLAQSLCAQGRRVEAEPLFRELVETRQLMIGTGHPLTLGHQRELAYALGCQGKFEEAERICRELLAEWEKIRGPDYPEALDVRHMLAVLLAEQEKYEEAERLVRAEIKARAQGQGKEHEDTLKAMELLGDILNGQGRYKLAEQYYRQIVQTREEMQGPDHPDTLEARYKLALALHNRNEHAAAEKLLFQTLEMQRRVLGESHFQTLETMGALASVLRTRNRDGEAEQLDRQILELHGQNNKVNRK